MSEPVSLRTLVADARDDRAIRNRDQLQACIGRVLGNEALQFFTISTSGDVAIAKAEGMQGHLIRDGIGLASEILQVIHMFDARPIYNLTDLVMEPIK